MNGKLVAKGVSFLGRFLAPTAKKAAPTVADAVVKEAPKVAKAAQEVAKPKSWQLSYQQILDKYLPSGAKLSNVEKIGLPQQLVKEVESSSASKVVFENDLVNIWMKTPNGALVCKSFVPGTMTPVEVIVKKADSSGIYQKFTGIKSSITDTFDSQGNVIKKSIVKKSITGDEIKAPKSHITKVNDSYWETPKLCSHIIEYQNGMPIGGTTRTFHSSSISGFTKDVQTRYSIPLKTQSTTAISRHPDYSSELLTPKPIEGKLQDDIATFITNA